MGAKTKKKRNKKAAVTETGAESEVITEIPDETLVIKESAEGGIETSVETSVETAPEQSADEKKAEVEKENAENLAKLKDTLLANLDNPFYEMTFFSETMYKFLLEEGKVVNVPLIERGSNYHSLPFNMPYDEKA